MNEIKYWSNGYNKLRLGGISVSIWQPKINDLWHVVYTPFRFESNGDVKALAPRWDDGITKLYNNMSVFESFEKAQAFKDSIPKDLHQIDYYNPFEED